MNDHLLFMTFCLLIALPQRPENAEDKKGKFTQILHKKNSSFVRLLKKNLQNSAKHFLGFILMSSTDI